jgi:hypothetical protein
MLKFLNAAVRQKQQDRILTKLTVTSTIIQTLYSFVDTMKNVFGKSYTKCLIPTKITQQF